MVKPSHECLRSQEFGAITTKVDEISKDVEALNKVVMVGNGEPALASTVPQLSKAVSEELVPAVRDLRTGLSGFMKFQSEQEGYHKGKEAIRNRNRWLIGVLITLILGLLGTMVTLMITKLPAV